MVEGVRHVDEPTADKALFRCPQAKRREQRELAICNPIAIALSSLVNDITSSLKYFTIELNLLLSWALLESFHT